MESMSYASSAAPGAAYAAPGTTGTAYASSPGGYAASSGGYAASSSGGYAASAGGYGASAGGYGASAGGYAASTGGYGAAASPYGAAAATPATSSYGSPAAYSGGAAAADSARNKRYAAACCCIVFLPFIIYFSVVAAAYGQMGNTQVTVADVKIDDVCSKTIKLDVGLSVDNPGLSGYIFNVESLNLGGGDKPMVTGVGEEEFEVTTGQSKPRVKLVLEVKDESKLGDWMMDVANGASDSSKLTLRLNGRSSNTFIPFGGGIDVDLGSNWLRPSKDDNDTITTDITNLEVPTATQADPNTLAVRATYSFLNWNVPVAVTIPSMTFDAANQAGAPLGQVTSQQTVLSDGSRQDVLLDASSARGTAGNVTPFVNAASAGEDVALQLTASTSATETCMLRRAVAGKTYTLRLNSGGGVSGPGGAAGQVGGGGAVTAASPSLKSLSFPASTANSLGVNGLFSVPSGNVFVGLMKLTNFTVTMTHKRPEAATPATVFTGVFSLGLCTESAGLCDVAVTNNALPTTQAAAFIGETWYQYHSMDSSMITYNVSVTPNNLDANSLLFEVLSNATYTVQFGSGMLDDARALFPYIENVGSPASGPDYVQMVMRHGLPPALSASLLGELTIGVRCSDGTATTANAQLTVLTTTIDQGIAGTQVASDTNFENGNAQLQLCMQRAMSGEQLAVGFTLQATSTAVGSGTATITSDNNLVPARRCGQQYAAFHNPIIQPTLDFTPVKLDYQQGVLCEYNVSFSLMMDYRMPVPATLSAFTFTLNFQPDGAAERTLTAMVATDLQDTPLAMNPMQVSQPTSLNAYQIRSLESSAEGACSAFVKGYTANPNMPMSASSMSFTVSIANMQLTTTGMVLNRLESGGQDCSVATA